MPNMRIISVLGLGLLAEEDDGDGAVEVVAADRAPERVLLGARVDAAGREAVEACVANAMAQHNRDELEAKLFGVPCAAGLKGARSSLDGKTAKLGVGL